MTGRVFGQAVAIAALLALIGCERIGNPFEVLGAKPPAPDEFQVVKRKPLHMPASLALPPPRPGAPSPLDPTPNRDAELALLGTSAQPAAPAPGAGEQALLAAANANATEPGIRRTLEREKTSRPSGQPYEPPLIWELFGGGEKTPKDIIKDPAAEARRLQSEGVAATPVDPTAVPPVEEEEQQQQPVEYSNIHDRRPQNKLPSSTSGGS